MIALALTFLLTAPLATHAVNQSCAKSVGAEPDRTIHGRLAVYNGGYPNLRLWPVKSHHLFGIYSDTKDLKCLDKSACFGDDDWTRLPSNVDHAFHGANPFQVILFGDFVVRPLARFRAGSMQPSCIVSADHLIRKVD